MIGKPKYKAFDEVEFEFVEKSVKVIGNIYNPKEEDKEYNSND